MLKDLLNHKVYDVIDDISDFDDMFQGNREHYFHVGYSAFHCIELSILLANKDLSDIKKILDFPCGYGRVLRVLKAALPDAQITACDLVRGAVDFCEKVFSVTPAYSDNNLDKVILKDSFDLIWVGSLFTHLDLDQWQTYLYFFKKFLNPSGILIFTTHGRYPASLLHKGERTYGLETEEKIKGLVYSFANIGFGFSNYFHSSDYGISLSAPSFVLKMLEQHQNFRILMSFERGWDNHQDVFACAKQ